MGEFEPETERARELRDKVGEQRWCTVAADAQRKAIIVEAAIVLHDDEGVGWTAAAEIAAPGVHWSTFLHWRRRYYGRTGPAWERLLDERVPPEPMKIAPEVRVAAQALRANDRSIGPAKAEQALQQVFGAEFSISESSLRRIWAKAGLGYVPKRSDGRAPGEEVEEYHGGGGLALLLAAEAETGATMRLARAVQTAGRAAAEQQGEVTPPAAEQAEDVRDAHGRFRAAYNKEWLEARGDAGLDGRLAPDAAKRAGRELSALPTLKMNVATVQARLLVMGLVPLLSERRGFAGLSGPAGEWLGVLDAHAYMPATLSKFLAELGLLDVGEALWDGHAGTWCVMVSRWTADGSRWLQVVAYIDASQDPYWTRRFALSGKVSRAGRVMPCLSEAAITAGPGVPLLARTFAGTVSLKKELVALIARLDAAVGEAEVGRLLVIDAEMGTKELLATLTFVLKRAFITVLKGFTLQAARIRPAGDWEPYRKRDELRELDVVFTGSKEKETVVPKEGFYLRGVEMRRRGSRNPTSTVLVTILDHDEIPTAAVADAYLSRWPHQEGVFRNRRNGGGLNRSHGYCGEFIKYVALETKVDKASRGVERARRSLEQARQELAALDRPASADSDEPPQGRGKLIGAAKAQVKRCEKKLDTAETKKARLDTMPREIYARDPGRDNIMTCLKLNVLMLVEFVLKEYFGGLRMELRTFIEALVSMPVTVRRTRQRLLFQIHATPRSPKFVERLRGACEVINARRLRRNKRLLVYCYGPG